MDAVHGRLRAPHCMTSAAVLAKQTAHCVMMQQLDAAHKQSFKRIPGLQGIECTSKGAQLLIWQASGTGASVAAANVLMSSTAGRVQMRWVQL